MFKTNKQKLALIAGALGVSVATTLAVPLAAWADQQINDNLQIFGGLQVQDSAVVNGGMTVSGGAVTLLDASDFELDLGTGGNSGPVFIGGTSHPVTIDSPNWHISSQGDAVVTSLGSTSDCVSTASPAVCGSSMTGSVTMTNATTSIVVNDSAVTANSQIFVIDDQSLGSKLGITCNQVVGRSYVITARTPGTSFTIKTNAAPSVTKACLNFMIIN